MAYGKYIKVTLQTGEVAVVKTSLLPFYASHRASIAEPTQEEILAAFPEERIIVKRESHAAIINNLRERIAQLDLEVATLKKTNDELREKLRNKTTKK